MHTARHSLTLFSTVVLGCLLHATTLLAARITVSKVSPNSGPTAGGTAVTITGTDFASAATVTFGGTAATHVVVTNSISSFSASFLCCLACGLLIFAGLVFTESLPVFGDCGEHLFAPDAQPLGLDHQLFDLMAQQLRAFLAR